jgi:hypothetical protein
MSQFWEAALNRFKAYVEAEESRNEQPEDSVSDSGKRRGD